MAGHAHRHEAVEAGANAIARWDLGADRQARPALQGTVGDRKCGEAVGPVFGTDLHRRGAAPDDVERAGARFVLLARYGRPGRRGILDGDEGLDLRRVRGGGKAARNGDREIVGGARLHVVVCVDPGSLQQRGQRDGAIGHRAAIDGIGDRDAAHVGGGEQRLQRIGPGPVPAGDREGRRLGDDGRCDEARQGAEQRNHQKPRSGHHVIL